MHIPAAGREGKTPPERLVANSQKQETRTQKMCMSLPKLAAEQGDFRGLSAIHPLPKKSSA